MNRGYIKIWRKFQDCFFYQDSQAVHLWVHLLLEANHKEKEFMFNGKKQVCPRGCFITGRKKLADKTKINEHKVYRLLETFEIEQLIEQRKFNTYSMITILNYNEHQDSEQQNAQPVSNGCTTSEQPVSTTNTLKNYKKIKQLPCQWIKDDYPYLHDPRFESAFNDFLEERRIKKKPATVKAQQLLLIDLHKHQVDIAIQMISQSIKNGWQGIFDLKQDFAAKPTGREMLA